MLKPQRLAPAAALAAALATATVGLAPAASAHAHSESTPPHAVLASGLLSPLRAAIAPDGTAYVSQNFKGEIDRVSRSGHTTTIYTDPDGNEVGGLSWSARNLFFTVTQSDQQTGENTDSWLKVRTPSGVIHTIADLHAYEVQANPDQTTTYGFRQISPDCAAKWPTADNGPATYTGAVDSHPYATLPGPGGSTFVADAGANDVLLVSPWGDVTTVATLPAIPFKVTSAVASGLGLDSCFVGLTYWFEPVPTDIERGRGGALLVTSLPGGPEGPQLGARGSVFAISAHDAYGRAGDAAFASAARSLAADHSEHMRTTVRPIVTGLLSPTGLAVAPGGDLYVAELFGDTVARVTFGRHGAHISPAISTPMPGEAEWRGHSLYVTSNVLSGTDGSSAPAGQLIRYDLRHGHDHGHHHR